jgi:hypothetical protein
MVARPDHDGIARGIILTLSNPGSIHFIPASAPVVLRRLNETTPQMGFVHSDSEDYATYVRQLNEVAPEFANFALLQHGLNVVQTSAA